MFSTRLKRLFHSEIHATSTPWFRNKRFEVLRALPTGVLHWAPSPEPPVTVKNTTSSAKINIGDLCTYQQSLQEQNGVAGDSRVPRDAFILMSSSVPDRMQAFPFDIHVEVSPVRATLIRPN